jgi:hypothetical protein
MALDVHILRCSSVVGLEPGAEGAREHVRGLVSAFEPYSWFCSY